MQHIIQIGACGGKDSVMSILSESLPDTKIHLIEPLYHNYIKLQNNYINLCNINDIIFYNCAISTYTGQLKLYLQKEIKNNPNNLDEHCSMSLEHLLVHGHQGNIASTIVDCYSLNEFIKMNNINFDPIIHLYLDTEGHDCDILLATNFNIIDVSAITFEIAHSDGPFKIGKKLNQTLDYLSQYNYKTINKTNFDITLKK